MSTQALAVVVQGVPSTSVARVAVFDREVDVALGAFVVDVVAFVVVVFVFVFVDPLDPAGAGAAAGRTAGAT
jgi:hypothetical protein